MGSTLSQHATLAKADHSGTYAAVAPADTGLAGINTANLQAAIDALSAAGGGILRARDKVTGYTVALAAAQRHALKVPASVVLDGLVLTLDPTTSGLTSGGSYMVVEIGDSSTGASNVSVRNCKITPNQSVVGTPAGAFISGIAARHDVVQTVHSDNVTIERNTIVDSQLGIYCSKNPSTFANASARSSSRFVNWRVVGNVIDTTGNKAIELQESVHSIIESNYCTNVTDGPQLIMNCSHCGIVNNRVQYTNSGINLTHGGDNLRVVGNVTEAISASASKGIVLRTEPVAETPTMSNVTIVGNTCTDVVSAGRCVFGFNTRTENNTGGTVTWASVVVEGNIFNGKVQLYDDGPLRALHKTLLDVFRFIGNTVENTLLTNASQDVSRAWLSNNAVRVAYTHAGSQWMVVGNEFNSTVTIAANANYNSFQSNKCTTFTVTAGATNNSVLQNQITTASGLTDSGTSTAKANNLVAYVLVP